MNRLKHLQQIFRQLASEQQNTLLAFAEFLQAQSTEKPPEPPQIPQLQPRQADESVIAAIKRLAKSYPMLDKAVMLNETSRLMTEHIMQGRDKNEVIDELELVFANHYEKFEQENVS
ncbi:MAG: Crp/Fnr family transcriptional regulator [Thiomargarita sp.]|nr:Crp/Fnr family transcriptional regulator [Thiomargarita sp.]